MINTNRQHLNDEILLQKTRRICPEYFTDDISADIATDSVFTTCLERQSFSLPAQALPLI